MDLTGETLTEEARARLIRELVRVLDPAFEEAEPRASFLLLPVHQRLLAERPILVVGERGAGKSALFRFLNDLGDAVPQVFPRLPSRLRWIAGFEDDAKQPATSPLWQWARSQPRPALEQFWLGHLVGWLARTEGIPGPAPWFERWRSDPGDPASWVPQVGASLAGAYAWLDAHERRLAGSRSVVVVGYDDLDRIEQGDRLVAARSLVVALVGLWQSLAGRHRHLQTRILLRPDLADHVRTASSDASKLRDRTLELGWTPEDVFRVLLRRIAASEDLRRWVAPAVTLVQAPGLGWVPPDALPDHAQLVLPFGRPAGPAPSQEGLGIRLAGETIGRGMTLVRPHLWLLNRAVDGLGRPLPRVLLNLVKHAAGAATASPEQAPGVHLLRPEHLAAAVKPTGIRRLEELREVYPEEIDAVRRLGRLERRHVPMTVAETEAALPSDHLARLVAVGVLTRRPDGRIDAPELFRDALGLVRRGRPPRPR